MKDFLKSLSWADYFYMAFTDPRRLATALMRESKSLPLGFAVPAIVSIIEILSLSMLGAQTQFFYTKITYGWILCYMILIFQNIVLASLIDAASQAMGCQGNVKSLVNILNYSLFPRVLLLPAVTVFCVFNFAPVFFYVFFSMALLVWSAVIVILGISEMHSTAFARATAMFLMPFIMMITVLFFTMVLTGISIVGYFTV